MPAEVPERVAVMESQQAHYDRDLGELKREMVLLRQQLDAFVRDATPIINAVREQQAAKAKLWNAVAIKVAEYSIVAVLAWFIRGVYLQASTEVAHQVERESKGGRQ
jgi:hypothetical protein